MEVSLLAVNGIPEDALLSMRAGTVRRQATISSGRAFRFPTTGMDVNPLKIDILQQVATAYVVMKPGEDQYKVSFAGDKSINMNCEIGIKKAESPESPSGKGDDSNEASATAAEAKDYLENHQILQFVQAVLQTVIKERPDKPFEYMARHFMSGYEPSDVKAPKTPLNTNTKDSLVNASADKPAAHVEPAATPAAEAPPSPAAGEAPAEDAPASPTVDHAPAGDDAPASPEGGGVPAPEDAPAEDPAAAEGGAVGEAAPVEGGSPGEAGAEATSVAEDAVAAEQEETAPES